MHFFSPAPPKSTADVFHPGSQTLENHNLLYSHSKWGRTKWENHYFKQGIIALKFQTISLVQEHHLPERSWVTIEEHSYKKLFPFFFKVPWLTFRFKNTTTTPTTTHMLMKDRLSPSLVNEERPEWLLDSNSKWCSLADAQGLQPGAIKLSISRRCAPTTGTVSYL